jgi:hypothetical protein
MNTSLTITETRDENVIWRIITDRSVFGQIIDDDFLGKPLGELQSMFLAYLARAANHTMLVEIDGHPVGCFLGIARGYGNLEIHTCLTQECRGGDAIAAGKQAMRLLFAMPEIVKLTSFCPMCIRQAYLFARRCGWKDAGLASWKWVRNSVEYNVELVECKKEDFK